MCIKLNTSTSATTLIEPLVKKMKDYFFPLLFLQHRGSADVDLLFDKLDSYTILRLRNCLDVKECPLNERPS